MAVEIYINGNPLELREETQVQINYTIGDIFNIGYPQSSFTNSFQAPLTPDNIKAFEGLGLVGNNSQIPYQKVNTVLKYDGFDLLSNGILYLERTNVNYQIGVFDGVKDFYKDIENKTIGNDLDISSLDHDKNMFEFTRSMQGARDYTYLTADFGGKMQLRDNVINIDYLIPVVKLSYFWDKIFETFGYTYSGSIFSDPDFIDACITYPKAPDFVIGETLTSQATKTSFRDNNPVKQSNNAYEFPNSYNWTSTSNNAFGNWNYKAQQPGTFRIRVKPVGYIRTMVGNVPGQTPFTFEIWKGTSLLGRFSSGTSVNDDFSNYVVTFSLLQGEEITFKIKNFAQTDPVYLQINSIDVEVYTTDLGSIDFTEAFSDFSIKDFVREIIWRYALTPVYDSRTKHITFYTIKERIDFDNYVDWSEKYVNREEESYLFNSYAQNNLFTHKYNDEGDNFNDGKLTIANANLETTKTIVASKIYSGERTIRTYNMGSGGFKSNIYPLWRSEIKEGVDDIKVEYKGLNGRFYIMKLEKVNAPGYYRSELLNSSVETTAFYYVPNSENTHYVDLVSKYYPTYQNILNNFKMHVIEVALTLPDVLQLDFLKLYYFEQEGSFYMLNKLQWQDGKPSKGEFIKISK